MERVNGIAGSLRAFRIDGDQLRADLHLLEPHPARERILEMAEKMPASFGLSIAYLGGDEEKNGTAFARITELLSVDLVSDPAANPTGLFAATASKRWPPPSSMCWNWRANCACSSSAA